jgi:hypothetical protein
MQLMPTEEIMAASHRAWPHVALAIAFAGVPGTASAAELNPAAVTYKLPDPATTTLAEEK